jgi:glyoxylase-like metal-dependent hydrolase (beta-lactamase superfamily II)
MTTIRRISKPPPFRFGRRTMLMGAGLVVVGVVAPRFAVAAPPFKVRHGRFDITVYSDGHMVVPASFIAEDAPADQLARVLKRSSAPAPNVWPKANIPLIRHGGDLILFDVGDGGNFQPTEGQLLAALQSDGVDPLTITKVVVTHAHPDHLWGMVDANHHLNFPNAHYYVGAKEWEFWMAADVALQLPEAFRSVVPQTQGDLAAIKSRMTLIKAGDEVVPGIRAFDTPGHTPGHLSFEVEGDSGLIITADALTHEIISVEYPDWHNGFDFASDVAILTRKAMLDRLSNDKTMLLSYHFPYPGTGHVRKAGTSYRFDPGA